jgi:Cu-processing system ATP-binding protein
MIKIQGLHKRYRQNHVLKDINLEISDPGIYAILGPNGSGKTTLLKSIIGLVIPDSGDISIGGNRVSDTPLYRNDISYLPQIARFPDNLRVYEIIRLIKDIRNQDGDETPLIDLFNLEPEMKKRLGNLSGGTRQKVNMVLGFLFDTPVLILDEPTVSLDPLSLSKFKKMISEKKDQGKIILYTTHIMSLVEEFSDRVLLLLDGKIIFNGGFKEILSQSGEKSLENAVSYLVEKNGNGKIY